MLCCAYQIDGPSQAGCSAAILHLHVSISLKAKQPLHHIHRITQRVSHSSPSPCDDCVIFYARPSSTTLKLDSWNFSKMDFAGRRPTWTKTSLALIKVGPHTCRRTLYIEVQCALKTKTCTRLSTWIKSPSKSF